jgi:outer membrane protein assembly factor BamD (BamD/ComL family)
MVFNTDAFDKYDDTQLKLGFCYFKMGKMRSAVGEFQNLLTYYPNSEHVTIAVRQIGIIEQYTTK